MTSTRGYPRPAISMASAPSLQGMTPLPADLSRYAIRSLLALLSSITRVRSCLLLKAIPRHDKAEGAALSESTDWTKLVDHVSFSDGGRPTRNLRTVGWTPSTSMALSPSDQWAFT